MEHFERDNLMFCYSRDEKVRKKWDCFQSENGNFWIHLETQCYEQQENILALVRTPCE